jgi:SAM-dependent methyltransferase
MAIEVSPMAQSSKQRVAQKLYYEEECDPEFEIRRPRDCGRLYEFLIQHKFLTGTCLIPLPLSGATVLEICGGSGMMAEKFACTGASITSTDFSFAAVCRMRERARRYKFELRAVTADADMLPFADRSFDIVTVHDGLHHLEHPVRAIREMARIAAKGVLIMDPAKAALTRVAVKLGIAEDIEDAGNEVRRLEPQAVAEILRECGFDHVRWQRTLMYYPHRPSGWFRRFDSAPAFAVFRAVFWGTNIVFGRWGNKLALVATR